MVAQLYFPLKTMEGQETQSSDFKWTTVNLQEVVETSYRLEAGVYGIEGRQIRQDLEQCKWDIVRLGDKLIEEAFYLGRFKRIYVEEKNGVPFILPSQMTEVYPKANKFISPTTNIDIESTRVEKGQVLLTRSGTIGVVSYVSKTLENQSLSDDVIRIKTTEYSGYIYAYLKSRIGRLLVETNNYGAVIKHIEPQHLNAVPIPNPPPTLKQEIHDLIEESFKLRDESNELMDIAQLMLKDALQLPDIDILSEQIDQYDEKAEVLNFSVPASEVIDRLDGSYYDPIVKAIETHISERGKEIVKVANSRVSQSVNLPGRFKRVYVKEGTGIVFFTGKHVSELDPSDKKYLSFSQHTEKIENELVIREGMILITRSGTLGKIAFVPKHWDGWAITDDIIRLVPTNDEISGYLYAWLSSGYARELIHRFAYGAVVRHLEKEHIMQVSVPLLRDEKIQWEINEKVLEANRKRTEAYNLEQEALRVLDEKVIYAR